VNDKKKVFFSDESKFNVNNHAGNCFVRRYQYEEYIGMYTSNNKAPNSVMFWGCITSKRVGRLSICSGIMNAQKYIETQNAKPLPIIKNFFLNEVYIYLTMTMQHVIGRRLLKSGCQHLTGQHKALT